MSVHFDFLFGLDFETTGVCVKNDDPLHNKKTGERHQAVSGGFIVADAKTYEPIEKLYLEIKWNDGVEEEEAVMEIANLIIKYWGTSSPLNCLGHNVHFDIRFLKDMFKRHDLNLRVSQRNIDSFTLGHTLWNAHDSDELFNLLIGSERKNHNALEDIEMTLESIAISRNLFGDFLKQNNIARL